MKLIEFFRRLFRRNKRKAEPAPEPLPPAKEPAPRAVSEPAPAPQPEPIPEPAPVYEPKKEVQPVEEPAPEPAPEIFEEPAPEPETKRIKVTVPAGEPEFSAPQGEVVSETVEEHPNKKIIKRVIVVPSGRLVNVRYDRSFTAKMMQTTDTNKSYYSELKNELLSYKKVHTRISWKLDSFRKGRNAVARIAVRGKTLCLYLALDPKKYEESKYIVEDVSEVKKNEDTPCLYRIKNDRRLRYAKELIAEIMASLGAVKQETETVNYVKEYPHRTDKTLLERGLIKLIEEKKKTFEEEVAVSNGELEIEVPSEVTVADAEELLEDEIAEALVRESESLSVRGKQTIVNVDTLDEYFEEGEKVTPELMRERIPFLNKKASWVKVLARGSISKALEVEADDFSLAAVKMIILAGGNVYRKRKE